MSTAIGTTHHRFGNPAAAAAAVLVIVGGAAVVGVALAQNDDTSPSTPAAPAEVNHNPVSRVGQGDFTQTQKGTDHRNTLRGGHTEVGIP